ncbi:glycogenin [Amylocystis lapponica]|nr:glycogenin [Amylocystis lapponica]
MATPFAFVTLVTSDRYLPGALAVAAALKDIHPSPPLAPEVDFQTVCLVTPETVDVSSIKLLRRAFGTVIGVELIEQENEKGLQLLGRPDLNHVLTKLHIFRLTQYSKLIFLDADVLPIRPLSHLFKIPHEFAAVPDVGWPDIFNSGVMVLSPGEEKFTELMHLLQTKGSWDGGDQGLLNEWRGGDWHKLSFTYNTTPTAAYTYAPAYERFGSQISAIHFIGPNKPWASIAFRAPGVQSAQKPDLGTPSGSPQQAYDYASLLDRWYDVYDRHYRSNLPTARADFEVRRYASAWHGQQTFGAELPHAGDGPALASSGGALGLDDLRRIAVGGMSAVSGSTDFEEKPHEGEYKSMPLEGRVDLMRPRREPEPEEQDEGRDQSRRDNRTDQGSQQGDDQNMTPKQLFRQFAGGDEPRMDTLPTPGPDEIPPAPYHHGHSLPPTPFYPPQQQQGQQQYYEPGQGGQDQLYSQQQSHQQEQYQHQPYQDSSQSDDGESQPHPVVGHHHQSHPTHHRHSSPTEHRHHHHHHHQSPPRPPSPPKLSWNPAVEPPPNNPPAVFAFPADTYFPNIWDQVPSRQHDATHQSFPPSSSSHNVAPHSDGFFNPPPPAVIPEQLVREGQYAGVIGQPLGHAPGLSHVPPTPDRTKVHAVFPWEEKPRHAPRRVFPASDSPPPSVQYIEPEATPHAVSTPSAPQRLQVQTTSPPVGLPFNFTYSNAWDSVPSIQRYASRLVRPPPRGGQPPQAQLFEAGRWERERERVVQARQDASSMDGDDEDEGDEDEPEEAVGRLNDTGESGRDRSGSGSTPKRSRASSAASAGQVFSSKGKQYRGRGVQTAVVETRSQGVQVNVGTRADGDVKLREGKHPRGGGMSSRRDASSLTVVSELLPPAPVTMRDFRMEPDQMATATPLVSHSLKSIMPFPSTASPTGLRSPQTLGSPRTYSPPKVATPPKALSPPKVTSPPRSMTPRRPSIAQQSPLTSPSRRVSNSTTSSSKPASPVVGPAATPPQSTPSPRLTRLASPFALPLVRTSSNDTSSPSTQGPVVTPVITPESTPIMSPSSLRKGGRVWDPARGVDVFKRGSEEVLARFLRMGSFDEDERERRSSSVQ